MHISDTLHICIHLLAPVFGGVVEGELSNAVGLLAGHNLETLDNTRHRFVFKR